jgi:integrase/recombinase XerD
MGRSKISTTKRSAQIAQEERLEQYIDAHHPLHPILEERAKIRQEGVLITEAWNLFMMDRKMRGGSKATIDYYDRCWRKMSEFFCIEDDAPTPISYLENHAAQLAFMDYLEDSYEGELSIQTINSYLRGYRSFGNFCLDKGFISHFECHIKEVEAPLKETYTDKELAALTVKPSIEDFTEFRNYCIVMLMLSTAARCNTLLNIRIMDVDLDTGYVTFNTTKAHKVAKLGLHPKTHEVLREYIYRWRTGDGVKPRDALFCNEYGEKFTRNGLYKAIASYNKSRGVEKTSLHLFRHTFAKKWIMDGGDAFSLQKVLTHSDMAMVQKYSNLYANDVKEKIEEHSALSQIKTNSGQTLRTKKRLK